MKMLLAISVSIIAINTYATEEEPVKPTMSKCDTHEKYASWKETKITADVHQALNRFMQNVDSRSPIKQVLDVRALNEDGRYFAFEVELKNDEVWHGTVHHNPRGDYLVNSIPRKGKLCP
ncbi:hypothetical protein L4C38_04895 [Vibrio kasasachensis]|uniref:hypothetical protein n=1 Tax=Vibrio kasasachensis TaxID=2910248 RepID=UPI003D137106